MRNQTISTKCKRRERQACRSVNTGCNNITQGLEKLVHDTISYRFTLAPYALLWSVIEAFGRVCISHDITSSRHRDAYLYRHVHGFQAQEIDFGVIWVANLEKVWNCLDRMGAIACFGFLSHLLSAHNSIIRWHIFMLDGALLVGAEDCGKRAVVVRSDIFLGGHLQIHMYK
jgi:hypothetical protein